MVPGSFQACASYNMYNTPSPCFVVAITTQRFRHAHTFCCVGSQRRVMPGREPFWQHLGCAFTNCHVASRRHIIPGQGTFRQRHVYVLACTLTFCCVAAQRLVVPSRRPFRQCLECALAFVTSRRVTTLCPIGGPFGSTRRVCLPPLRHLVIRCHTHTYIH